MHVGRDARIAMRRLVFTLYNVRSEPFRLVHGPLASINQKILHLPINTTYIKTFTFTISAIAIMPTIEVVSKEACHDWPLGDCKHGKECAREHDPNLNPDVFIMREGDPMSNELGEACQRCMQRMYPASSQLIKWYPLADNAQCDKKGRGGTDDPCSECRWFGGDNCICTLLVNTSYNDQIWSVMIKRGPAVGYSLPADKSREEGSKKSTSAPKPMPANKVKADWQGETREALLNKADMLPPGMRELPRAYLVPPRPSTATKKGQAWKTTGDKRKRESDASTSSSSVVGLPPFPPRPTFARPPADPMQGEVVATSYSWEKNEYTHTYAMGATVTGRATTPPTSSVRFLYPQSKVMLLIKLPS